MQFISKKLMTRINRNSLFLLDEITKHNDAGNMNKEIEKATFTLKILYF